MSSWRGALQTHGSSLLPLGFSIVTLDKSFNDPSLQKGNQLTSLSPRHIVRVNLCIQLQIMIFAGGDRKYLPKWVGPEVHLKERTVLSFPQPPPWMPGILWSFDFWGSTGPVATRVNHKNFDLFYTVSIICLPPILGFYFFPQILPFLSTKWWNPSELHFSRDE